MQQSYYFNDKTGIRSLRGLCLLFARTAFNSFQIRVLISPDLEKALSHYTVFLSPDDLQGLYSAFAVGGVFDFKAFSRQLFPRGEESAENDMNNYTTMVFGPNQHYETYQKQLSNRRFPAFFLHTCRELTHAVIFQTETKRKRC